VGGTGLDRVTVSEADARARVRSEVTEVRRLLRSGSSGSLRKAVILGEVLGPPAALKEGN
jgi:purine-nucleoside phosphorylase